MSQANPTATSSRPVTPGKPITDRGDIDTGYVENALLMGVDLGTSRTSIVAANGIRKTVDSYVGWAKDAVSRKHLKTDILFGKAALDNRLALDLYRPLEKGVIKGTYEGKGGDKDEQKKNLEAARMLIKHMVELIDPGRDDVLYGVIGVPAQATVNNKQAIIEIARDTLDSVMIVSEPFAVAYGMERTSDVLVIDIGAGTTDLCRMHGTVPADEDQISLTVAGDAIDEKLFELIRKAYPDAQLTLNMCKLFKDQYGFVSDTKDRIKVMMPVNGKPTEHDITDQVKQACEIIVQPILDGIHKLVSTFNPEFQEKLRNNIILAGGGSQMDGLNQRIEQGLERVGGGRVTVVEEPIYAGANGALQLAMDMPGEFWQQLR